MLRGTPRVRRWSFSPGFWHEPGLMPLTEPGLLPHEALAAQTGINAWRWSRFFVEPGLMGFGAPAESLIFY